MRGRDVNSAGRKQSRKPYCLENHGLAARVGAGDKKHLGFWIKLKIKRHHLAL
ncbi:hypothetical protein ES703_111194 [subsurface metagenome]